MYYLRIIFYEYYFADRADTTDSIQKNLKSLNVGNYMDLLRSVITVVKFQKSTNLLFFISCCLKPLCVRDLEIGSETGGSLGSPEIYGCFQFIEIEPMKKHAEILHDRRNQR